jgi:hypothetical protein
MKDMLKMADEMQTMIGVTEQMYAVTQELSNAADDSAKTTADTRDITDSLRNHISDFDDTWRPFRAYLYWDKHCFDVPVCWSVRSLFDSLDGFDQLAGQFHTLTDDITRTAFASGDDRHAQDHPWPDADDVRHLLGDDQPDGGHEQYGGGHGAKLRYGEERRHVLPAAGGVR